MVYEEAPADPRGRVDVDPGRGVRLLRDHARDERDAEPVELVGDAVVEGRHEARVAEDRLVEARGRRVAGEGGLHVRREQRAHRGEPVRERADDLARAQRRLLLVPLGAREHEAEGALHLGLEHAQRPVERRAHVVAERLGRDVVGPVVRREQDGAHLLHGLAEESARWEAELARRPRVPREERQVLGAEGVDHVEERQAVALGSF